MFRKFLFALVAILGLCAASPTSTKDNPPIELNTDNSVVLRGEVSQESVSAIIRVLETKPNADLVLYIQSPGGNIFAGHQLIEAMEAYSGHLTCVADVAISMAFVIFQHCPTRYVMHHSILMQHEASFSVDDTAPHVFSFVEFLRNLLKHMDEEQAARLGMTYADFKAHTSVDWWMEGPEAITNRAADSLANVSCTEDLVAATTTQTAQILFGQVTLKWSRCPLIRTPVRTDLSVTDPDHKDEATENYQDYIKDLNDSISQHLVTPSLKKQAQK